MRNQKLEAVLEGGEQYGNQEKSSKENYKKENYKKGGSQDDQKTKVVFPFLDLSVLKQKVPQIIGAFCFRTKRYVFQIFVLCLPDLFLSLCVRQEKACQYIFLMRIFVPG